MAEVFVSYGTIDRSKALPIVQALERQGWSVFWDRQIPPGKKWQDVLERQLRRAKCVVVLLTRQSVSSSWVTFEASIALERRIIVPLMLDPTLNPQVDLPEMYRDLHVVSLSPDADLAAASQSSDHWLQTIRETIRHQRRQQTLRLSALALMTLFAMASTLYVALTGHNAVSIWQAGITYIERGAFSKEENERLQSAIRNATTIDLLVPNATSFISAFRDDLPVFLRKKGVRMRVLFADPGSEFYDEMMVMTNIGIERSQAARESDRGLPARSRQVLLGYANHSPDKVSFRQFNTEFRAPLILVDGNHCFLTVRLTPDQAKQSLRIELANDAAEASVSGVLSPLLRKLAFLLRPSVELEHSVESCQRHFDAVWARAKAVE
jgi:hypothetical protein